MIAHASLALPFLQTTITMYTTALWLDLQEKDEEEEWDDEEEDWNDDEEWDADEEWEEEEDNWDEE